MDDGKSGSHNKAKRTDFLRMLDAAEKKPRPFDFLICNDTSRFGREHVFEQAADKNRLMKAGVKLVTKDGVSDWNSLAGIITDTLKSASDNEYSVKLGEGTLRGKIDKMNRGELYGQVTPYGFAREITDHLGDKRIVSRNTRFMLPKGWKSRFILGDEHEVETVRWIFSEYLKRDISICQLSKELNEKGIKSANGRNFSDTVVTCMLRNVRYAGHLTLGEHSTGEFYRIENGVQVKAVGKPVFNRGNRDTALIIRNMHPAIISQDVFDAVQQKIERNKRNQDRSHNAEGFALHGVLKCGNCGKNMFGRLRRQPKDGSKMKHRAGISYACKGWTRDFDSTCHQWLVHEDQALPFLMCNLVELIKQKQIDALQLTPPLPPQAEKAAPVLKKLNRLKAQLDTAVDNWLGSKDKDIAELAEKKCSAIKDQIRLLESQEVSSETDYGKRVAAFYAELKEKLLDVGLSVAETRNDYLVMGEGEDGVAIPKETRTGADYEWRISAETTPSQLREVLHALGVRMTLWFNKNESNRWQVAYGRIEADGFASQKDFSASHFASGESSLTGKFEVIKLAFTRADFEVFKKTA